MLKAMSSRAKSWAEGGILFTATISPLASVMSSLMEKPLGQIRSHRPQRLQELIMRFADRVPETTERLLKISRA